MGEVAGNILTNLTCFELSLLLLSAYLHDIGMTPEFKKVDAHFTYLLTAGKHCLTDQEINELQTWLDDEGYQVVPPISDATPLSERLTLAREIATHYCRHRHNDWSEEWIRANLKAVQLGNYTGWIDDLVLLCKSHHFGFEKIMQPALRLRRVANPSVVVNLRFLALVLRLADILEFDPERTPDIILRHRDISQESQICWWKDKEIVLTITGQRVVITARPSSARIHRAIEETADDIDAEMALCRKIADDSPLGAIPGEPEIPYPWWLPAAVHRNIEPRDGTYEYIDGAFRPDTRKILSLLSGTALYQTPFHAVRELAQNAFDAVAERIAYQRLGQLKPASGKLAKQLAEQHRVSLQLETEGADAFLVCTDNGIGMTKSIIRDRVLVAGSSPRHDVRALDRRCKEAGFDLGRSGKFGIGILSYFMISTNVEIETLRAQEAGDSDSTKWHFETEGVGSFGELRKLGGDLPGTRVRLRLSREISSNVIEWYKQLRKYLERIIVYSPCEFYLSSPLPACEPLELKPGWSPRDHTVEAFAALRQVRASKGTETLHLLSSAERDRRLSAERELAQLEQEIKSHLQWRSEEGVLSNGSANYVIGLPYFQIEGGMSLAYLQAGKFDGKRLAINRFLGGTHFYPKGGIEEAWKGMALGRFQRAEAKFENPQGSFLRINWVSDEAGKIMANRNAFVAKANDGAQQEVNAHWARMLTQFLDESTDSQFAWFNERIAGRGPACARYCRWLRDERSQNMGGGQSDELYWEDIKFPALSRSSFGYLSPGGGHIGNRFSFNKKPISLVPWSAPVQRLSSFESNAIGWNSRIAPPDRVVDLESWRFTLAPIWLRRPQVASQSWRLESKFPPQWREICGARFDFYAGDSQPATVWNDVHPLVRQVDRSSWDWSDKTFRISVDPLPHKDALLSDVRRAASWFLQCISRDSKEIWDGLPERDPMLIPELINILFPRMKSAESWRILFRVEDPGPSPHLRLIDSKGWTVIPNGGARNYLPTPPTIWRVSNADIRKTPPAQKPNL
jgi:hypothetical protein